LDYTSYMYSKIRTHVAQRSHGRHMPRSITTLEAVRVLHFEYRGTSLIRNRPPIVPTLQ